MKVILLKDVPKIGKKDAILDFSDGFAQNVLISKGLAIMATPNEVAKVVERLNQAKIQQQKLDETFIKTLDIIRGANLSISCKASEKGHLFQAIKSEDVLTYLNQTLGLNLSLENISIDKPIKEKGSHKITLKQNKLKETFILHIK